MIIKKIVLSIFALYLLIFCNFTKELIGCKLNYILDTNIYYKHFVAFILLLFLIVLIDEENINKNVLYNIGLAIIIYILFIISNRIHYLLIFIILCLLLSIYILDKSAEKEKETNINLYNNYKYYQLILIIILLLLIFIGFIHYLYNKYYEYNSKFSFLTFIFGNLKCKLN
jgi:hypothetical protein